MVLFSIALYGYLRQSRLPDYPADPATRINWRCCVVVYFIKGLSGIYPIRMPKAHMDLTNSPLLCKALTVIEGMGMGEVQSIPMLDSEHRHPPL